MRTAFPWARSLVCVGLQYDTPGPYSTAAAADRGWIARYAWGDDYHDVVKARLEDLRARLVAELGPMESRVYVDTGPVVERAYAAAAGLGAWGKNTCLLHPEHGSWFFLGEVITDLELEPDAPRTDMCGSCTACLEACPTGALVEPYVLDATRCISYLTIEVKGAIPEEHRADVGRHVFGCDICQDVCPWNRRRREEGAPEFAPREGLMAPDLDASGRPRRGGLPRAVPPEPGQARQAPRPAAQRVRGPRQLGRRRRRPAGPGDGWPRTKIPRARARDNGASMRLDAPPVA